MLQRQASNLKTSGLVAGIDVLRAEAQVQRQRQRLIVAENEFEKAKLRLGRSIGLPPGSRSSSTDTIPFRAARRHPARAGYPEMRTPTAPTIWPRADRVAAAEARAKAASAERLPSSVARRRLRHHRPDGVERAPDLHRRRHLARADLRGWPRHRAARSRRTPRCASSEPRTRTCAPGSTPRCGAPFWTSTPPPSRSDTAQTTVGLANAGARAGARSLRRRGRRTTIEVTRAQESLARASEDRIDASVPAQRRQGRARARGGDCGRSRAGVRVRSEVMAEERTNPARPGHLDCRSASWQSPPWSPS